MSSKTPGKLNLQYFESEMIDHRICIFDDVISKSIQIDLLNIANNNYKSGDFSPARIGKGISKKLIQDIRGDMIYWIEDWSPSALSEVKIILDEIMIFGRKGLYMPLKRFESHFSFYPVGSFYLKHVDRHQLNPSRLLSAVLYIGEMDGDAAGELVVYSNDKETSPRIIKPQPRRLVVFDSSLEHEVKVTKQPRWSLTSWFRDDVHPLINI